MTTVVSDKEWDDWKQTKVFQFVVEKIEARSRLNMEAVMDPKTEGVPLYLAKGRVLEEQWLLKVIASKGTPKEGS
jgi:hypothetical protein